MFFFDLSMIGLGINLAVMLYMTIFLPFSKGVSASELDFEKECPKLIPIVTVIGVLVFFW